MDILAAYSDSDASAASADRAATDLKRENSSDAGNASKAPDQIDKSSNESQLNQKPLGSDNTTTGSQISSKILENLDLLQQKYSKSYLPGF